MSSDRDEIVELMSRYAVMEDTKNYEMAHQIFAADVVSVSDGFFAEPMVGIASIQDALRRAVEPLDGTHHMFTNFIVSIEGDQAEFQTLAQAVHIKNGLPGGSLYTVGLTYNIRARRTHAGWRVAHVRISPNWASGNPEVLGHLRA
jgi:hypothetical protein